MHGKWDSVILKTGIARQLTFYQILYIIESTKILALSFKQLRWKQSNTEKPTSLRNNQRSYWDLMDYIEPVCSTRILIVPSQPWFTTLYTSLRTFNIPWRMQDLLFIQCTAFNMILVDEISKPSLWNRFSWFILSRLPWHINSFQIF